MKKNNIFLKISLFIIALPVAVLCLFLLPREIYQGWDRSSAIDFSLFGVIYATAVPFFLAILRAYKLITAIDQGKTDKYICDIRAIKWYAITICGLYVITSPLLYIIAQREDAPGILLLALIVIFVSFIIATLVGIFERLFAQAITTKV